MTAHPTSCTIDLGAYLDNLELIGRHVGAAGVCPVVKADAYGHGLAQIVPAIEAGGFERLAVAQIGEAVAARSLGFTGRVLVLSAAVPELVASHDDPDFEHTVPDLAALERVADTAGSTPRRIHLKIDTGMGRLGTDAAAAAPLIRAAVAEPRVEIVGVYTHFANADAADLSDARDGEEIVGVEEHDALRPLHREPRAIPERREHDGRGVVEVVERVTQAVLRGRAVPYEQLGERRARGRLARERLTAQVLAGHHAGGNHKGRLPAGRHVVRFLVG